MSSAAQRCDQRVGHRCVGNSRRARFNTIRPRDRELTKHEDFSVRRDRPSAARTLLCVTEGRQNCRARLCSIDKRRTQMKRELMFGTVLATAFAAGIAAQQPSAPPPSTPPSAQQPTAQQPTRERPPSPTTGARTVTVTGCLTPAAAAGAEPGAAPSGSPAAQFTLTNATIAGSGAATSGATPGAPPSSTGTTGATPGSAAGAASSYRLSGGGDSLKQYANSRVEVTGTLQGDSTMGTASSPGSSTSPGAPGPTAGSPSTRPGSSGGAGSSTMAGRTGDEGMQTLRVTSVKQVSGSCAGEGR
jgi:hypothetical protein